MRVGRWGGGEVGQEATKAVALAERAKREKKQKAKAAKAESSKGKGARTSPLRAGWGDGGTDCRVVGGRRGGEAALQAGRRREGSPSTARCA